MGDTNQWPLWTQNAHDRPSKTISKLKYGPKGMEQSLEWRGFTQDTKSGLKDLIKRIQKKPRQKVRTMTERAPQNPHSHTFRYE